MNGRATSDLPFGSEFSPSQIDLPELLELVQSNAGDWRALEAAILARWFTSHGEAAGSEESGDYNRAKLANNCKLGLIAYRIIERDGSFTDFGRELYDLRSDDAKLYAALARHILLNLNGLNFIQCILDMQVAGETVTLTKLREWLGERGINFPPGGKHPSIMRLWLERAGVFASGWRVDEGRLQDILGAGTDEIEALASFSREQQAYLRAIANSDRTDAMPSNEIARMAAVTYGVRFDEKGLPKQVLYPLEKAGYIELTRGTKEAGRGAKPFMVKATAKLVADLINPIIEQLEQQVHSDLRPMLRKPLAEILIEVESDDRHIAGLALESLAFKLMRLLDMTYVATRLRGAATGGAEVDLVFESARLVFSRWQIQCKNTGRVSLDDVAKEVGLTHFLKSNAIIMVSTGDIGPEARKYAAKIMTDSNLAIVMMDGADLAAIKADPAAIITVFHREARFAMRLKALEALE
jgi:site-specific DNA-methyltransferase (cytosine-N4-specific)